MDKSSSNNLHVVLLSSPEAGHVVPILALARRLAELQGVRSTVLLVTTGVPSESIVVSPPRENGLVEIVRLPPVDISSLVNPSTKVATLLYLTMQEAVPLVRSAIAAMDRRPDAFVVVYFGTDSLRVAAELNIPKYVLFTSTAWFLALSLYCPILDEKIKGQYIDKPGQLDIPGCKPVRPEDVVDMMLDRDDQQYREYLRMGKEITALSDGILLNTCGALEAKTLQAFVKNEAMKSVLKSPVYPIGPLTRPWWGALSGANHRASLGIGAEPAEISMGGPAAEERPCQDVFFPDNIKGAEDDYLPRGFSIRTKKIGLLVPTWGQQVEILAHPSIGGFMSHCGWNSALESIVSGVPLIAWPLYAEQKMNASYLAEELQVAVRPEVLPTKKMVGRDEIEKMVRTLMEHKDGQAMRDRANQLRTGALNWIKEGGSSHQLMSQILTDIQTKKSNRHQN
ncbi:anthocyanidin 3-O-glucosyltransferase 5-like [Dorcoceras hygrometricum]|uniref:Glycosyltransferase n=1 Tax=Dorcoceras hygrometricum TaxID=472368 RepID=A0A2Z7B1Z3_9LAMI|nr:anthocyanidin 3-O-glucosyltransferase 5-like [Dorcoceras hygrometricum]